MICYDDDDDDYYYYIIVLTENFRKEKEQIDLRIFSHKLQAMKKCNAQPRALSVVRSAFSFEPWPFIHSSLQLVAAGKQCSQVLARTKQNAVISIQYRINRVGHLIQWRYMAPVAVIFDFIFQYLNVLGNKGFCHTIQRLILVLFWKGASQKQW